MMRRVTFTLLRMAATFFVILTAVFFISRATGSPLEFIAGQGLTQADKETLIRYYELDRPLGAQFAAFLGAFLDGNFGLSLIERRPVTQVVGERIWPSLQLLATSSIVTLLLAPPLGMIAALWRRSWIGAAGMTVAFIGYAVPNFILATLLVLVFAYWLDWLPVVGNGTAAHFVLPVVTLSATMIAAIIRFTRNAMLDVLGQDYMRTARAKGLSERAVVLKHGLRNAAITILSAIGLQIAALAASGSIVVESVFSWPGIGDLLVGAALQRDYPMLQFAVLVVAGAVILMNTAIDLAYAWADPRLRRREAV